MYTLEKCEELWKKAIRLEENTEHEQQAEKWLPYYQYLAENYEIDKMKPKKETKILTQYMCREKILTSKDHILDIGAGMGDYALEFASYCAEATALEISKPCIEVLRRRAEQNNIQNISTILKSWEEFSRSNKSKFDVVFSAMCPAICNIEQLLQMEAFSRRHCCLVAPIRGSYDKHRKAMMKMLKIKPQGMVTEAIHYMNTLYLMNRQVDVKTITVLEKSRISEKTAIEQFSIYFKIFGISEEQSSVFIREYFKKKEKNGFLEDESCLKFALISWKINTEK